jgi:hypothetical protein
MFFERLRYIFEVREGVVLFEESANLAESQCGPHFGIMILDVRNLTKLSKRSNVPLAYITDNSS